MGQLWGRPLKGPIWKTPRGSLAAPQTEMNTFQNRALLSCPDIPLWALRPQGIPQRRVCLHLDSIQEAERLCVDHPGAQLPEKAPSQQQKPHGRCPPLPFSSRAALGLGLHTIPQHSCFTTFYHCQLDNTHALLLSEPQLSPWPPPPSGWNPAPFHFPAKITCSP